MFITSYYLFKDYKRNENLADETVSFVRKLRDSDLKRSNVILDMKKKELVKCRSFNLYGKIVNNGDTDVTYQRILDYFHAQHPQEVGSLITLMESNPNNA